jgi:hypothetical protein
VCAQCDQHVCHEAILAPHRYFGGEVFFVLDFSAFIVSLAFR